MSDNEDLLGEDLGDHSLADYNLGNEEEEQLLADDYDTSVPQNVPSSLESEYIEPVSVVPNEFPVQSLDYNQTSHTPADAECVVPNITVEVPNISHRPHSTYAPYEPPVYDEPAVVPPPIPAAPVESPQIVPSEVSNVSNGEPSRVRFQSERTGPIRTPQQRNIPDSLDKVIVPGAPRGRNTWRHPQYRAPHPYRRHHYRGNFSTRHSFPPPQARPPPEDLRPEQQMGPEISPERPILPQELPLMPLDNRPFNQPPPRFPYRSNIDEPNYPIRPNFERPMFYQRPAFNPRFAPPVRDITPGNLPQVTIQSGSGMPMLPKGREPEVRMLPVQLPSNLPPGGLAGKKVLINPHFKGNFQPPIEGLPAYIPTRIQKTPPLSPTLESKFGPIKDIDDAAERFIAEQRNALARAAGRKFGRRSPQRYIENTTIEIENDLARRSDDELLRRQEEFINANRAGLRRRMRSPTPPRRSPSPRRARAPALTAHTPHDEDSEYRKRVREQENMRERVLRAKEVRRRKNAVALQKQLQDREKELEKEVTSAKTKPDLPEPVKEETKPTTTQNNEQVKPDTTRKTPEKTLKDEKPREKEAEKVVRDRSPVSRKVESAEANSTCEALTPPRETHTPPLDDDELDLILGDIDGILSEDDEPAPQKPATTDLRAKLPPKTVDKKPQRQKIVFSDDKDKKKKEKSPIRRTISTTKNTIDKDNKGASKIKANTTPVKSRQKITFTKQTDKEVEEKKSQAFTNRRVILQRKSNKEKVFRVEKTDPSRPHPGIFSRAVTAIVDVRNEPQIEFDSGSDEDVGKVGNVSKTGKVAVVQNLPHGMTDTRLGTLAGNEVQSLSLDKEERSAKIIFKTTNAAETFKKKFNNKMVAASRLTVNLR